MPILLQPYKLAVHFARPVTVLTAAITTGTKRSTDAASGAAATTVAVGSKKMMNTIQEEEQLPFSNICNCWPANPALDPKRVLLRRLLFFNEDEFNYVSVGFYPARDYQPLVEFNVSQPGGSKPLILTDEQVDTLA